MNYDDQLLVLLKAAYKVPDHSRVGDTSIHVSDLIDFCPREYWLCKTHDRAFHPHKYHSMGERYTHDMGHAIQRIQVRRLLTQQVLFGAWRCRHCNDLTYGFQDDKMVCEKCKCRALKYDELGIEVRIPVNTKPKSQIVLTGHKDIVIAVSEELGFVVDSKSIKAEDFDELKPAAEGGAPPVGYRRQVQLYMHLPTMKNARFEGRPRDARAANFRLDPNHAVVCYACKGQRQVPYKPYLVEQDPEFIQGVEAKVAALKKALETGKSPAKPCTSPSNLLAKQCSVRDVCFDQRLDK